MAGDQRIRCYGASAVAPRTMPARCESSIAGTRGEALLTFTDPDIRLEQLRAAYGGHHG